MDDNLNRNYNHNQSNHTNKMNQDNDYNNNNNNIVNNINRHDNVDHPSLNFAFHLSDLFTGSESFSNLAQAPPSDNLQESSQRDVLTPQERSARNRVNCRRWRERKRQAEEQREVQFAWCRQMIDYLIRENHRLEAENSALKEQLQNTRL